METSPFCQVNPAHGVALTYWQNLLIDRITHVKDHNGYMLGASYLAAALVVAACRRSAILRSWTSVLVILSILSMGVLLLALTITHNEVIFYAFFIGIQCVYEVSTSVSTFQVGCEVCKSVENGGPKEARLALLFCITGVMSGAVGALVQHVNPISRRFMMVAVSRHRKKHAKHVTFFSLWKPLSWLIYQFFCRVFLEVFSQPFPSSKLGTPGNDGILVVLKDSLRWRCFFWLYFCQHSLWWDSSIEVFEIDVVEIHFSWLIWCQCNVNNRWQKDI